MNGRGTFFSGILTFLFLSCFSHASGAEGVVAKIENSKPVSGAVSGHDVDRYSFEVTEGGNFIATLINKSDESQRVWLEMLALTPDGEPDMGGSAKRFFRGVSAEPQAENWTLEVRIDGGSETAVPHELSLLQIPGAKGTRMKFGETYTGTLSPGSVDVYTFNGTPDVETQALLIPKDMEAGFFHEVMVFSPKGMMVSSTGSSDYSDVNFTMAEHGKYTVFVWRTDDKPGKGEYTLSVKRVGESVQAYRQAEAQVRAQAESKTLTQEEIQTEAKRLNLKPDQVFREDIEPVWPDRLVLPRRYANIFKHGMFLTFSPDRPDSEYDNLAEQGNTLAQIHLGDRSYSGGKIEKTAVEWWRKAAAAGNADARNRLGMFGGDAKYQPAAWYRRVVEQGKAHGAEFAEMKKAQKYPASSHPEQAMKLYREGAEKGDAVAQFNLAVFHTFGLAGEPDFAAAAEWYGKAAEQGLTVAQNNLGELHEHGAGVAKDLNKAVALYRKAAEAGYPRALYNLGRLAATGRGMEKDGAKAAAWFGQAAEAGHADARGELLALQGKKAQAAAFWRDSAAQGNRVALRRLIGLYRAKGVPAEEYDDVLALYRKATRGVNQEAFAALGDLFAKQDTPDRFEAYYWYSLAAIPTRDFYILPDEMDALVAYAKRQAAGLAGKLSPEQIAVAKWRIKDRNTKPPTEDQLAAAEIYLRGYEAWRYGKTANALLYFLQAESKGIAKAQHMLGYAYRHGSGVYQDIDKAIEYFRKAVLNGHVGSATMIGTLHHFGLGVPVDFEKAAAWYELDASRANKTAINRLGWLYIYNIKDGAKKALAMYEKAAARDVLKANNAVGMLYLYGAPGVAADHRKALAWYLKAVEKNETTGSIQAAAILAKYEPRDPDRALGLLAGHLQPVALNNMAYLMELGLGAKGRETFERYYAGKTPMDLYRKAADMCYGRAMFHIARLLMKENPAVARTWMERGARYGSAAAAAWLIEKPEQAPDEEITYPPLSCEQIQKEMR